MDGQDFIEKHIPLIKKHLFSLILALAGLLLIGYGLIQFFNHSGSSNDIVFEESNGLKTATESASKSSEISQKTITVDVEGAVVRPGIYQVAADARVQDGLIAASGLSDQADRSYVAKNMNLALKLRDGSKIYIPKVGENVGVLGSAKQNLVGDNSESSSVININTASEAELDSLPGVGIVTAQKIITNRPYNSIEELISKKAVSKSVFEKIKNSIAIN